MRNFLIKILYYWSNNIYEVILFNFFLKNVLIYSSRDLIYIYISLDAIILNYEHEMTSIHFF